ncbi:MAG: hypothetical protein NC489_30160 [Ruminococcus flavefaciens]|nr:hypothetical protein [Ruminococcus flavefaciens]
MEFIEALKLYVERTKMSKGLKEKYNMSTNQMLTLLDFTKSSPMEAIFLAFDYGRAKGYRAAKGEQRR